MLPAPPRLLASAAFAVAALPAFAAPQVVADIAPTHSIVARVMAGVGTPELLVPPGASEHAYALRPSEASMLQEADLVVWAGAELTPWLDAPLEALAGAARLVTLAEVEGAVVLPVREGGPFEAHLHDEAGHDEAGHDDGEHGGADHGHDEHHAEEAHAEADHGHDEAEGHGHEAHGEAHDMHAAEAHGAVDGHLWLDPVNGARFAEAVAEALAEVDAPNAEAYRANAAAFAGELDALTAEIEAMLAPVRGEAFVVFHDAYQYFEARFAMPAAGSIALGDAAPPSAARLAEIRDRIAAEEIACIFAEPQYDDGLIASAIEGSGAASGVLDPIGAELEPGPALYPALLRGLAADLAVCLGQGS